MTDRRIRLTSSSDTTVGIRVMFTRRNLGERGDGEERRGKGRRERLGLGSPQRVPYVTGILPNTVEIRALDIGWIHCGYYVEVRLVPQIGWKHCAGSTLGIAHSVH